MQQLQVILAKVSQGSIVGGGHKDHDLGSCGGFTQYDPSYMRPFCLGVIFHSVTFFALEMVRGHNFWIHLETCLKQSDLLPLLLNNETEW